MLVLLACVVVMVVGKQAGIAELRKTLEDRVDEHSGHTNVVHEGWARLVGLEPSQSHEQNALQNK